MVALGSAEPGSVAALTTTTQVGAVTPGIQVWPTGGPGRSCSTVTCVQVGAAPPTETHETRRSSNSLPFCT